jgi:hypothetical protein
MQQATLEIAKTPWSAQIRLHDRVVATEGEAPEPTSLNDGLAGPSKQVAHQDVRAGASLASTGFFFFEPTKA